MEFNVENIVNGAFSTANGKSKTWNKYVSMRLLTESGFEFGKKQKELIDNLKYRWYFFTKVSDENKGLVIVALHKKDINSWLYVAVESDGTYKEFKSIKDAKNTTI